MISSLNPKNLNGIERKIFNYELIFLNPNYKDTDTPTNYRDWLDLIYECIHNPQNPNINIENAGVKRASELVRYENIDPYEWELSKIEVFRRRVIELEREAEQMEVAQRLFAMGADDVFIAQATTLSLDQIQSLRKNAAE